MLPIAKIKNIDDCKGMAKNELMNLITTGMQSPTSRLEIKTEGKNVNLSKRKLKDFIYYNHCYLPCKRKNRGSSSVR